MAHLFNHLHDGWWFKSVGENAKEYWSIYTRCVWASLVDMEWREYGVSATTILDIIAGRKYKRVK